MIPMPITGHPHGGARDNRRNYITPMGERWTPPSPLAERPPWSIVDMRWADRIARLASLVAWLDVASSLRWQKSDGKTYCDHYATDFFEQLTGRYVLAGWCWWTNTALRDLRKGKAVEPKYADTVVEVSATGLFDWLLAHGSNYGWREVEDAATLAAEMERLGQPGVIATRRKTRGASHITVALPRSVAVAMGRKGFETGVLQTEAGGTARQLTTRDWHSTSSWGDRGFWLWEGE